MQRQIMECCMYVIVSQIFNYTGTLPKRTAYNVKNMRIVVSIHGESRNPYSIMLQNIISLRTGGNFTICKFVSTILKCLIISSPQVSALTLNILNFLQLAPQKCCGIFRRQERRAIANPTILVHLSAEKLAAVCPLLPNNLRIILKLLIVNHQQTALSALDILSLME